MELELQHQQPCGPTIPSGMPSPLGLRELEAAETSRGPALESPPGLDLPPGWDQVAGRLGVENCLSLGGSSSKPPHWLPARQEQAEVPPRQPAPPVPARDLQFLLPRDLGLEGLEEPSAFPAFAKRRILPELPRFPLLVARLA